MNFGDAIAQLKNCKKVARAGWNGKNMYIFMEVDISPDLTFNSNPYITMITANGSPQKGWLASQADIFAEDWMVVV